MIAFGISISNKHRLNIFDSKNNRKNEFRNELEWKARRPDHWQYLNELKKQHFKNLTT
jgi:hypothetical protein